jgi:hypothetical protein
MDLDEWTRLVKHVGPSRFKPLAVAFLREHFGRPVEYADGTGDGGVDAWVVLAEEPLHRRAVQMFAGESDWVSKLESDVRKLVALRQILPPERAADTRSLLFVCTQTPSAVKFEEVAEHHHAAHDVVVRKFDARAIAAQALEKRTVFELLSRELPEWGAKETERLGAHDEALLAFSLFHEAPSKFRWAVAKAAVATVLHRDGGACDEELLAAKAGEILGLSEAKTLIERTVRNLASEQLVTRNGRLVEASEALAARTKGTLALAEAERRKLVDRSQHVLKSSFRKGTHHPDQRAKALAEGIVEDLGVLVRSSTVAAVPTNVASVSKLQSETHERTRKLRDRLENELDPTLVPAALDQLIAVAAGDPFARRLAEAELFMRLTSVEASELAQALQSDRLHVMLDASVAMPLICAKYDRAADNWPVSVAASALHQVLTSRGATIVVPSVYREEIAVHLRNASNYAAAVGRESALARSGNYFVAHYCSTRGEEEQTSDDFLRFLEGFGGSPSPRLDDKEKRRAIERELTKVFLRYGIVVEAVDERDADAPLAGEPKRSDVLLRHDRAVVRTLASAEADTVLCTADTWLQATCADREILAVDSAALADLLGLVRPAQTPHPLVSPLALGAIFGDDQRTAAAAVWDAIVSIEGEAFDHELVLRAKAFRNEWLERRKTAPHEAHDAALRDAWMTYREAARAFASISAPSPASRTDGFSDPASRRAETDG